METDDRIGTFSDIWDLANAGRFGVLYILAPFLGPTIGPLIGAYIIGQYNNDWKYAVWVVLFILAPISVSILFMKETSKKRILSLRAKRRGTMLSHVESSISWESIGKAMLRPLHMCFLEVRIYAFFKTTMLILGSLYRYLSASTRHSVTL
jgi:MFS family permease